MDRIILSVGEDPNERLCLDLHKKIVAALKRRQKKVILSPMPIEKTYPYGALVLNERLKTVSPDEVLALRDVIVEEQKQHTGVLLKENPSAILVSLHEGTESTESSALRYYHTGSAAIPPGEHLPFNLGKRHFLIELIATRKKTSKVFRKGIAKFEDAVRIHVRNATSHEDLKHGFKSLYLHEKIVFGYLLTVTDMNMARRLGLDSQEAANKIAETIVAIAEGKLKPPRLR